jgi:4-amino-4-deoxy-L-arabinose transferase-like glycosyltransferase
MVLAMARRRANRRKARGPQQEPVSRSAGSARERTARATAPSEPPGARRTRALVAAGVGLVAFVAYALTASRDIFPGDTPEFITVALTGGVAHPPGYPLFSIIGALFGQLPLGPLPFRINVISALAHAATVSVVFLTAERLTRDLLAAAAAALLLAFGALFWSWSLVAEAFPLNDLLAALVLYCLVLWHERPMSRGPLFGAAVAFGLGVANHQTITLLVPAIAYVLWTERRFLRGRQGLLWQVSGALVLMAALPYAYIFIAAGRHELLNWGGIQSPLDLARQFFRLDYGTGQLIPTQAYQGGTQIDRLVEFAKNVNPALAILVACGAVQAYRRIRWYFWTTVLAFVFSGLLFTLYANANVQVQTARFILVRFFLLPQVVVAPLAALGLVFLVELVRRRMRTTAPAWLPRALAGVAFAVAAIEVVATFHTVDLSDDHVARDFAVDLLATTPSNAVLLAGGDHIVLPLAYLQAVEHARPDVTVVFIPILPIEWYQRELKLHHPDLNIPLARYDQPDGLLTLMQANVGRTFVLTGEQADQRFGGLYGVYGRGLLLPIIGPDTPLELGALRKDNEDLMAAYHVPSLATIKPETFERFILDWYALVWFRLGKQYEDHQLYADARTWYEKALAIEPQLPEAQDGMRRVQGR